LGAAKRTRKGVLRSRQIPTTRAAIEPREILEIAPVRLITLEWGGVTIAVLAWQPVGS